MIGRHLLLGRRYLGRLYDRARALAPARRRSARAATIARRNAIGVLDLWSRNAPSGERAAESVLIDGMWDNANFWIRYALLRRALHLTGARETGLLGGFSRKRVREAFACQGINDLVDYHARTTSRGPFVHQARKLLATTQTAGDVLEWSLPHGFPAALVFDGILKRQRRATVDLSDPLLADHVAEALACIDGADRIVEEGGYDLVVLSHALDYTYAALAWAAIRREIPVVVLYGDYGTARFIRMSEPDALFAYPGRPSKAEIDAVPEGARQAMAREGGRQLDARLKGQAGDVGSNYAYRNRRGRIDRRSLCDQFGWDPERPLLGVYAPNWFDYPHVSGLRNFRDFLDWTEVTLAVAAKREDVNWLFKAHPCDDWYPDIRGPRLEDVVRHANGAHLRLADESWNGLDLIDCLDGIITCHGTIGLEAAHLGKPVLTAHRGWYGHAGFSISPDDRDGYTAALATPWWAGWDAGAAAHRARIFAGWYFCLPDWHGAYVYRDDSEQDAIYADLEEFLSGSADALAREIETIRDWYDSGHPYYHVFKIGQARNFQTADRTRIATPPHAPEEDLRITLGATT